MATDMYYFTHRNTLNSDWQEATIFFSHVSLSFRHSLYRGLLPVLSSLYCSNFLYFYTFNGLKTVFVGRGKTSSSLQDLLFGYLAGNVMIVYNYIKETKYFNRVTET